MSQKPQELELVELGDIDTYEVYDEIIDFIQTTGYPFNVNEWSNDYLYEIEESDSMEFYLLMDSSKQIMGFICVELYEDYIWIVDILVSKKFRGHGYAKHMIREVMEIVGVDQVVLNVNPLNTNAIIAYLKMGFVITGYVSSFYSDGSPCVYMKMEVKQDGD